MLRHAETRRLIAKCRGFIALVVFCTTHEAGAQQPVAAPAEIAKTVDEKTRAAKLEERDRLDQAAREALAAGQFAEAIVAAKKLLEIEREVLPAEKEDIFSSLNFLAQVSERTDALQEAEAFRVEALSWSERYRGAKHWKTIDARLALEHVRILKSLSIEQRGRLNHAVSLNEECVRLYTQGRLAEAAAKETEVAEIRKQILGKNHPMYAMSVRNLAQLHQSLGDGVRAEPLYVEALALLKQILGEAHPVYPASLNQAAGLYLGMQNYVKAKPLLLQAEEVVKRSFDGKHPDYVLILNNLTLLYTATGDHVRAEARGVQARELTKQTLGEKSHDYAICLNNLAKVYEQTGADARAVSLYLEAREILKQTVGERHPVFLGSSKQLADLYSAMGDKARAEPLYLQILEIQKQVYGENHRVYLASLKNLADFHSGAGNYSQAEPLYGRISDIVKREFGETHVDYAMTLTDLATVYSLLGDRTKTESTLLRAHEVYRRAVGEKHELYAKSLVMLAIDRSLVGDYARAEPLYVEAREIFKTTLGENHPDYASCLLGLAMLYGVMGDFSSAEPLFVQSCELAERSFGAEHPACLVNLQGLGVVYLMKQDYVKAEPIFIRCCEIAKRSFGATHPMYAGSLDSLCGLYVISGDFARAEPLAIQSLDIFKQQSLGEESPTFAIGLSNLARIRFRLGKFAEARPLYEQALEKLKRTLGEEHPNYATTLSESASLHLCLGEFERAEPLFRKSLITSRNSLNSAAAVQSERQQLAMGQFVRPLLDNYISLGVESRRYAREIFGEVLSWKGSTLVRQRGMRQAADEPAVAESLLKLQSVAGLHASLSRAVPKVETEQVAWRTRLAELSREKERLEAELSDKSSAFRLARREPTLSDLLAALPNDAVLIDYVEFNRSMPAAEAGKPPLIERQLAAFVVRHAEEPENEVRLISLGASAPSAAAIDKWRAHFGMDAAGEAAGVQLRAAIWEPLLPAISAAKTILVSTDGPLGRLPLGALPGQAPGTFLLEDHRLAMLPVPKLLPMLVGGGEKREAPHELLLLGDVEYDTAGTVAKRKQPRRPGDPASRSPGGDKLFDPLANTAGEVATIKDLYGRLFEAKPNDPFTLIKSEADEKHFRELAPTYRHLHLATHGFFADRAFASAESPGAAAQAAMNRMHAPTMSPAADGATTDIAPSTFTGIGAMVNPQEGSFRVESIIAGGAAATDGRLKPGDAITKIGQATGDMVDVGGKSLAEVFALVRGAAGTKVRIEVEKIADKQRVVYELVRKTVQHPNAQPAGAAAMPSPMRDLTVVGHDPGLLSGLALAGANLVPTPDQDDGILTAQEIAMMNLAGVDTVVLSACDTGLGETAGGEGLLGVQRAFQVAGARTTVASFWKVDDLVTRVLMERFYLNLWDKDMSRLDALREAQLWVLHNPGKLRGSDPPPEDARLRTSPKLWAAFAISGDWR